MELGNQIFGHNNERVPIDRERFQDLFVRLCEKYIHVDMHIDSVEIANDVFEIRPYYWGDCECDYDKKSENWSKMYFHQEGCYRHAVVKFTEEIKKLKEK